MGKLHGLHGRWQRGGGSDDLGCVSGLFLPSPPHYPPCLLCRSGGERLMQTLYLGRAGNQCSSSRTSELLAHKLTQAPSAPEGESMKKDRHLEQKSILSPSSQRIRKVANEETEMSTSMLVPNSPTFTSLASCY